MKNILLNNGQNVIIGSNDDAIEVIGENLSYELADYLRNVLMDSHSENETNFDDDIKRLELEIDYDGCKTEINELKKENESYRKKYSEMMMELAKWKNKFISDDDILPF